MTPLTGLIIAVIAGWLTRSGRRAAAVLIVPFLALTFIQTYGIAAGDGHSPPDTVWPFGPAISYYVVQVLILALVLGVALPLGALRGRAVRYDAAEARRATVLAGLLSGGFAVAIIVVDVLIAKPVAHHSADGGPPWYGLLGILLLLAGDVVLGVRFLIGRRAARRAAATVPASAAGAASHGERVLPGSPG
jgi:hypothetical protein